MVMYSSGWALRTSTINPSMSYTAETAIHPGHTVTLYGYHTAAIQHVCSYSHTAHTPYSLIHAPEEKIQKNYKSSFTSSAR